VDEAGDRVRHTLFTPFGKKFAWYGEPCRRKRFAGHEIHHDTGLVYMQARWMDPNAGTFLSIDSLVGDAFDPQAVNAYSYARNNPVSFTDPTGM
jgi:RHS repeat-associated protein